MPASTPTAAASASTCAATGKLSPRGGRQAVAAATAVPMRAAPMTPSAAPTRARPHGASIPARSISRSKEPNHDHITDRLGHRGLHHLLDQSVGLDHECGNGPDAEFQHLPDAADDAAPEPGSAVAARHESIHP